MLFASYSSSLLSTKLSSIIRFFILEENRGPRASIACRTRSLTSFFFRVICIWFVVLAVSCINETLLNHTVLHFRTVVGPPRAQPTSVSLTGRAYSPPSTFESVLSSPMLFTSYSSSLLSKKLSSIIQFFILKDSRETAARSELIYRLPDAFTHSLLVLGQCCLLQCYLHLIRRQMY